MANPWEVVYRGLTLGGAQDIGITKIDGLVSTDIRIDRADRVGQHGSFVNGLFLAERHVVIEGDIAAASGAALETYIDSLRGIFSPLASESALVFRHFSAQRRVNCRPVRFDISVDDAFELAYPMWAGEFICEDPRIYDDTLTTLQGTGATSISLSANNTGTVPAAGILQAWGPGTTFTFTEMTSGKAIKVNTTLAGTSNYVEVDTWNRTVKRGDTGANLYGSVDSTTVWWDVPTGSNTLRLTIGSGGSTSTKFVAMFRNAWN